MTHRERLCMTFILTQFLLVTCSNPKFFFKNVENAFLNRYYFGTSATDKLETTCCSDSSVHCMNT
jgi:hypothetical protein